MDHNHSANAKFQDASLAPMHTVEHLLNGIVSRKLGCSRAFTTHIEKKKSKIDLKCSRALTETELAETEAEINRILSEDVAVTEEWLPIEEARKRYDLYRLPDDAGDTIRIIHIGTYDACPCIGRHVGHLREIGGKLKIISSDYQAETGTLRIRFKIIAE